VHGRQLVAWVALAKAGDERALAAVAEALGAALRDARSLRRYAAAALGVSPSTLQDWLDAADDSPFARQMQEIVRAYPPKQGRPKKNNSIDDLQK
jgi:hypothetical protein